MIEMTKGSEVKNKRVKTEHPSTIQCAVESCAKSFSSHDACLRHMTTHAFVRPYGCNQTGCSYYGRTNARLQRHKAIHHEDRGLAATKKSRQQLQQFITSYYSSADTDVAIKYDHIMGWPAATASEQQGPLTAMSSNTVVDVVLEFPHHDLSVVIECVPYQEDYNVTFTHESMRRVLDVVSHCFTKRSGLRYGNVLWVKYNPNSYKIGTKLGGGAHTVNPGKDVRLAKLHAFLQLLDRGMIDLQKILFWGFGLYYCFYDVVEEERVVETCGGYAPSQSLDYKLAFPVHLARSGEDVVDYNDHVMGFIM